MSIIKNLIISWGCVTVMIFSGLRSGRVQSSYVEYLDHYLLTPDNNAVKNAIGGP